ncbi:hypothetical protein BU17DRAFT_6007, partial [Hysterangium stoloniferum]
KGWIDEVELLNEEECLEFETTILPVKLALVKLQNLAYKIIHLTTIVLPAWQGILKELKMSISLMPHDMSTHWNSTFDMLKYVLKHQKAVDTVTQQRDL